MTAAPRTFAAIGDHEASLRRAVGWAADFSDRVARLVHSDAPLVYRSGGLERDTPGCAVRLRAQFVEGDLHIAWIEAPFLHSPPVMGTVTVTLPRELRPAQHQQGKAR